MDRKSLRPVFKDTLDQTTSNDHVPLPELVCIVEHDKKHDESFVCNGSIGYWKTVKGIDILNLYEESAQELGWNFVPSVFQTFYYVDNYKQGTYVSLNHYFDYFKKQRVNELESIAQDLGAKHVKIVFQEHEKFIVKNNSRTNVKTGTLESNTSYESSRSDDAKFEIAADIHFFGQDAPKAPTLVYFKCESDIERLVEMRMKPGNPIKSKDYHFQCSSSAGMSEKVAAKLDGILQQLKCSGTATISSEVQRENRTELNYHIEF